MLAHGTRARATCAGCGVAAAAARLHLGVREARDARGVNAGKDSVHVQYLGHEHVAQELRHVDRLGGDDALPAEEAYGLALRLPHAHRREFCRIERHPDGYDVCQVADDTGEDGDDDVDPYRRGVACRGRRVSSTPVARSHRRSRTPQSGVTGARATGWRGTLAARVCVCAMAIDCLSKRCEFGGTSPRR